MKENDNLGFILAHKVVGRLTNTLAMISGCGRESCFGDQGDDVICYKRSGCYRSSHDETNMLRNEVGMGHHPKPHE